MPTGANRRTVVLAIVAALLVAATIYDYTIGGQAGGGQASPEPAEILHEQPLPLPRSENRTGRLASILHEAEELRYFIAHASQVRARYTAIATPYAEAVASFATLYQPGEKPAAVARARLAQLLPAGVRIGDLLIAEVPAASQGTQTLTASLTLQGDDSAAFNQAILALGDAASGLVWKELYISGDADKHTLKASGQLAMLMVEQVE